jgi:DNA mismatch repair ATPase MutL
VSSVIEQEFSWSLLLEGRNQPPLLMPAPKRLGTLVAVRDLFYNTPARRKFLKSEKTETLALEEVFKRAALSQPSVAFKYQQGDRLQKRLPMCQDSAGHAKRVAALCGQSFIRGAYFIQAEVNGLKLSGWVGNQETMRAQSDLQYFYVNRRIVRDKVVMHAIRHAYEAIALPGRYPAYVLYFELDPTAVDVNVHPTKHEVRFREARTVHAFLSYAIQTGLKEGYVATHVVDPAQVSFSLPHEQLDKPLRKPLYLIDNELLLLAQAAELMVVDIKALRRLYLAECFAKAYTAEGVSQEILLMPKSITFKKIETLLAVTGIFWEKLGFNFSAISENVLLVRAIPWALKDLVEHLAQFLPTLLVCQEVNQAIDCLIQHMLAKEPISWEMSQALLATVKITDDCYKPLTAATLRKALSL